MSVPAWVWVLTIVAFAAMFVVDLLVVDHKPHRIDRKSVV